jgi:hypothetical protein
LQGTVECGWGGYNNGNEIVTTVGGKIAARGGEAALRFRRRSAHSIFVILIRDSPYEVCYGVWMAAPPTPTGRAATESVDGPFPNSRTTMYYQLTSFEREIRAQV